MTELYDEDCLVMTIEELTEHCQSIYDNMEVTTEQVAHVEHLTRGQADSKLWGQIRTGRVTASMMKQVCHTSITTPSQSVIQQICHPKKIDHINLKYGRDNEPVARRVYMQNMLSTHEEFKLSESGLWLSSDYPFLGATPDGIVECSCCGDGCLEIKCPISKRNMTVLEAAKTDPKFCLVYDSGNLKLNKKHQYYYQIQTQLFVCKKEYCDFVLWTEKDCNIIRIEPDIQFWKCKVDTVESFFQNVILPEVVGRFFTQSGPAVLKPSSKKPLCDISPNKTVSSPAKRQHRDEKIICLCQVVYKERDGAVIGCDNENCPYEWFHYRCVGIRRAPKGSWFCKYCRMK